jgi:hypothetical protein
MAKSANKGTLVAFHVTPEFHAQLEARARQHGFQSPALMARAIVERDMGVPETQIVLSRIGGLQLKLQRKAIKMIAALFSSLTEEDLIGD